MGAFHIHAKLEMWNEKLPPICGYISETVTVQDRTLTKSRRWYCGMQNVYAEPRPFDQKLYGVDAYLHWYRYVIYKFQWSARGATELLAEKHHGAKRNREHAVASFWVDNACACIMPAFMGDNNVFVASPGQNATGQNATGKALLGQNATNEWMWRTKASRPLRPIYIERCTATENWH